MVKRKTISGEKVFAEWRKDPAYVREYEALEQEFALARAVIGARARAGLTQAELAERMGTSQSAIARLESGKGHPSVATLERLAAATGSMAAEAARPEMRRKSARLRWDPPDGAGRRGVMVSPSRWCAARGSALVGLGRC